MGLERIEAIEQNLPRLSRPSPYLELYGCDTTRSNKTGIITFNVKDVHSHDVPHHLGRGGRGLCAVAITAPSLMTYLGQPPARQLLLYNTKDDIDRWIAALKTEVMHLGS